MSNNPPWGYTPVNPFPGVTPGTPGVTPVNYPYTRTVHFAPRTDGFQGTGQPYDPFNGSATVYFDFAMQSLLGQPNLRLVFAPGTYITTLGIQPADNWSIEGSGKMDTVIQLDTNVFVSNGQTVTLIGQTSEVTYSRVSNLTIQCNNINQSGVAGGKTGTINPILIWSKYAEISNVHAIGGFNNSGFESFPFYTRTTATRTQSDPAIHIIRDCSLKDFNCAAVQGHSGITAFCDNGTLANTWLIATIDSCTVINCPSSKSFSTGGSFKSNIRNCYCDQGFTLVTSDTYKLWNCTIEGCTGENLSQTGMLINGNTASQYKALRIINNVTRCKAGSEVAMGHYNIASPDMNDMFIFGNRLDSNAAGGLGANNAFNITVPASNGSIVSHNVLSANLPTLTATNCQKVSNFAADGTTR